MDAHSQRRERPGQEKCPEGAIRLGSWRINGRDDEARDDRHARALELAETLARLGEVVERRGDGVLLRIAAQAALSDVLLNGVADCSQFLVGGQVTPPFSR